MSFVNNDGYEYRTVWSIGGNRRENCTPPGKFFSLGGDLEPEELESELYVILDSLFAEGNQINF